MSAYTGQIDPVTGETIDAAAAAAPTPEEQEREALELLKELEAAKVDESEDREPWSPPPLELKPLVDESSCANVDHFLVTHADLDLDVDFKKKTLAGVATLFVKRAPGSGHHPLELCLDIHEAMTIADVACGPATLKTTRERFCDFGDRLTVTLPDEFVEGEIVLTYTTTGGDAATWLDAVQAGGKPFVFTMGQACLNRGLFPCQDAPRSRMTWAARVTAPAEFLVVAAAPSTKGPKTLKDGRRAFRFAMPVKVPAYLVAFAVGDLASRDVGPRSRVYAHPRKVEAAAKEFAGVTEKYLKAGEALFGTYSWGRYDLLMMPRAFAYGGMENPTLTYLSSTLVVGDGSLTDTVAHEIAHSWFGNLVTNGSWAEFFLNEGFTMYAQRRITRVVDGAPITDLEGKVGWRLLENEINVAQQGGGLFSRLRVPISWNVDPDDTYNDVPYEKGYALLCAMRDAVVDACFVEFSQDQRAAALDPWLRQYVVDHKEASLGAEAMVKHFTAYHPRAAIQIDWSTWLDEEGMPPIVPTFPAAATLTTPADHFASAVMRGRVDGLADAWATWPTYQRSYFLDWLCAMEDEPPPGVLYGVGRGCGLYDSKNCELTMRWALLVLKENLELRQDDVERHLDLSAKQKFVLPVFRGLHVVDARRAARVLDKIRPGLDVAVRKKCDKILAEEILEEDEDDIRTLDDIEAAADTETRQMARPGAGWAEALCRACDGAGCPKC